MTNNTVTNSRGQAVGYIRDNAFYRKFDPARHLLHRPVEALALDEGVISQIRAAGVKRLVFFTNDGRRYETSLDHFLSAARPLNLGFGHQRALPLSGFVQVKQLALLGKSRP